MGGEKKSNPLYREPIRIQPQEELRTDSIDLGVENQQTYKEPVQVHPEILKNGSSKSAEAQVEKSRGNSRKSKKVSKNTKIISKSIRYANTPATVGGSIGFQKDSKLEYYKKFGIVVPMTNFVRILPQTARDCSTPDCVTYPAPC